MRRKLPRSVVGMLAGVVLLVLMLLWGMNWRSPSKPYDASSIARPAPDTLARGAYLVRVGNCMLCHTERGGAPFAGGRAIDTPFGTVYSSNITPDKATGIGAWSSDDFWLALHEGRARDGRLLYPAFPYTNYTRVTRADADAMHAYLRSLPAQPRERTPHQLRWPYNTQLALAVWRMLYFSPASEQHDPARPAQWNRGAYLVRGLGHCSACHASRNALGASADMLNLSGGLMPVQNWYAPSLSSPREASVADWTLQQIEALLRTGVAPGASVLGPMAEVVLHSTQYLSAQDLHAIALFLKSMPSSAAQAGPPTPAPRADVAEQGALLYQHHCENCHGKSGEGISGAYPALAANRAVTMDVTANLVQVVLHGGFSAASAGNPRPFGMPPFTTVLSDAQVAAVLSHIRNAWGNRAAPVSELSVSLQRSSSK